MAVGAHRAPDAIVERGGEIWLDDPPSHLSTAGETSRGLTRLTELTRGGTAVRTARFMASRVLALVEHPAERGPLVAERPKAA
jgi:hypothetical protein